MKEKEKIDVTEYMAFTHYMVNKLYENTFLKKRYEKDDLLQISYMTLVKAARNFEKNRKGTTQFTTYLANAIRYELITYARRDRNYNVKQNQPHNYKFYSIDSELSSTDGRISKVEDILNVDGMNGLFEEQVLEKIEADNLLSKLDAEEYKIATMYFIEDMTQLQISKKMNTSQCNVSRKVREIFSKLKEAAKNPDQSILSSTIRKSTTPLYHIKNISENILG